MYFMHVQTAHSAGVQVQMVVSSIYYNFKVCQNRKVLMSKREGIENVEKYQYIDRIREKAVYCERHYHKRLQG